MEKSPLLFDQEALQMDGSEGAKGRLVEVDHSEALAPLYRPLEGRSVVPVDQKGFEALMKLRRYRIDLEKG